MPDLNDNDPYPYLSNPVLHPEGAWLQFAEAIKQIDNLSIRNLLWWLASLHVAASLSARLHDDDDECTKRLIADRDEIVLSLVSNLEDRAETDADTDEEDTLIEDLLRRMQIPPHLFGAEE